MRKTATALASSFALLLAAAAPAAAAPAVDGHFPVTGPFDANSKLAAGPDGNMWLTIDGATNDVARISPAGKVDEFELNGTSSPSGIAVGPEGKLWVTWNGGVTSFSPSDPKGTSVPVPIATVAGVSSIVAGPDGQMWVAAEGNVVHFLPANPAAATPIPFPGLQSKDIDVAGSNLVIATNLGHLILLSTSGAETDIALPDGSTSSQGVAGSPSGQIAFSKEAPKEGIGVVTPPGAPIMTEEMGGFGVARGSDGAYWFAMGFEKKVVRMTPDGKTTSLSGVPKFYVRQIAAGPNNTIWATMEEGGVYEVLRISGLEPPVEPIKAKEAAPDTKILKGPKGKVKAKGKKGKVKFTFSSTPSGAKFECALVKLPKKAKKKAPKPKFKGCKSPKKLKLKPGKYRFSVRAVSSGGLVDATPATRAFRVVHSD